MRRSTPQAREMLKAAMRGRNFAARDGGVEAARRTGAGKAM